MFNCFKKKQQEECSNNKIIPNSETIFINNLDNYDFDITLFDPKLIKKGEIYDVYKIIINNEKYICKLYQKTYTYEYRNEIHILKQIYSNTFFPHFFKNLVNIDHRFIMYKYLDGYDLSTFNTLNTYSLKDDKSICTITNQILQALMSLIKLNYVHLNVQPSNIIVSKFKPIKIKLIDLKYCQHLYDKKKPYRAYGYCSPEVVFQKKCYYNSDIWSLGCLIFFICTNTNLFSKNSYFYFDEILNFKEFSKNNIKKYNLSEFSYLLIKKCLINLHVMRPEHEKIIKFIEKYNLK